MQVGAAHWDKPLPSGGGGFHFLSRGVRAAAGGVLGTCAETVGSRPSSTLCLPDAGDVGWFGLAYVNRPGRSLAHRKCSKSLPVVNVIIPSYYVPFLFFSAWHMVHVPSGDLRL